MLRGIGLRENRLLEHQIKNYPATPNLEITIQQPIQDLNQLMIHFWNT